jgi:YrbI family 3-deoxy-D-manno-octulosonate 8-phosphate phosphatase
MRFLKLKWFKGINSNIENNMSGIIAFVPVRGGSKSIPGKNIKVFCRHPLVYWVLAELEKTNLIDEVIVATDSEEIQKTVEGFSFSKVKVYERMAKNANDTASTESVMLEYLEKNNVADDSLFLLVQATSPFTRAHHFAEAIVQFQKENADSLLSCVISKRFLWSKDCEPLNYDYQHRPRRQDFDGHFVENGAFYISRVSNIISNRNRLSGKISIYEMPSYTEFELDEEHDWIVAKMLMEKYVTGNKNSKSEIKLVITDVDGVLTDAGMYYSEAGDEIKKFNTRDGMGFELLRNKGYKTGIITSESTRLVERRAKKLKLDYLYQGAVDKLEIIESICKTEGISLKEVAYIGDDINDKQILNAVGYPACPRDAVKEIRDINNILVLQNNGGHGTFREFAEIILAESK